MAHGIIKPEREGTIWKGCGPGRGETPKEVPADQPAGVVTHRSKSNFSTKGASPMGDESEPQRQDLLGCGWTPLHRKGMSPKYSLQFLTAILRKGDPSNAAGRFSFIKGTCVIRSCKPNRASTRSWPDDGNMNWRRKNSQHTAEAPKVNYSGGTNVLNWQVHGSGKPERLTEHRRNKINQLGGTNAVNFIGGIPENPETPAKHKSKGLRW